MSVLKSLLVRVKRFWTLGIAEEVSILRERATISRYTYIASLVKFLTDQYGTITMIVLSSIFGLTTTYHSLDFKNFNLYISLRYNEYF
jgi:hypothetical protein